MLEAINSLHGEALQKEIENTVRTLFSKLKEHSKSNSALHSILS